MGLSRQPFPSNRKTTAIRKASPELAPAVADTSGEIAVRYGVGVNKASEAPIRACQSARSAQASNGPPASPTHALGRLHPLLAASKKPTTGKMLGDKAAVRADGSTTDGRK